MIEDQGVAMGMRPVKPGKIQAWLLGGPSPSSAILSPRQTSSFVAPVERMTCWADLHIGTTIATTPWHVRDICMFRQQKRMGVRGNYRQTDLPAHYYIRVIAQHDDSAHTAQAVSHMPPRICCCVRFTRGVATQWTFGNGS